MRLSLIFFVVLGLSVILGSIASLGTTYATSYSRLTTMATEFSEVAQDAVGHFGALVRDLVGDSSVVVAHVIAAEYNASARRLQQTAGQVTNITLDLLSFARLASNRSRADVQRLVASFGGFMQDVIGSFGSLASYYSTRLQLELAAKAQTAFSSLVHDRLLAIRRIDELYQLGILSMSHALTAPLTRNDCIILAALCDHSSDMSVPAGLVLGTYTGGYYSCHDDVRAKMYAHRYINGTRVPGQLYWDAYNDSVPAAQRKTWQQRCLTEAPRWEPTNVSAACIQNDNCTCGFDVRCRKWYRPLVDAPGPAQVAMTEPYLDFFTRAPLVAFYFPIYDYSSQPPALVAAEATELYFSDMDAFLAGLLLTDSTRLVVALNDSRLSKVGDAFGRAGPSGDDDNCSEWFLSQSCRPELRQLGQWLLPRRATLQAPRGHTLVVLGPLIWDIFPSTIGTLTYFTLVGLNASLINDPIVAAQRQATKTLGDIWTEQLGTLTAADAGLQAYLTSVEDTNLASLGAMRGAMAEEVEQLARTAQEALDASLGGSGTKLTGMLAAQTAQVAAEREKHLAALTGQLGWTVGIVLGVLLGILVVGLYGTLSITRSLGAIIWSMEEAATMNLDAVADPRRSWVTEVRRIQVAFHTLVVRLAHYKSFMPAALFEPGQESTQDPGQTPRSQDAVLKPPTVRRGAEPELPLEGVLPRSPAGEASLGLPPPPPQVTRRTVAVLAVNVLGFKGHLYHDTEGFVEALMNAYLTAVHETVARVRGHLDLVLGDQLFATFNGHVRCSDAANVAAGAALELRAALARGPGPASLAVQLGLAAGKAFVGSVGYGAFRTLLTVGTPMKLAAMLAHLSGFPDNSILTDPNVQERAMFHFHMPPVDLVHLPLLGCFAPRLGSGMPVYALGPRRASMEQEWLYQMETAFPPSAWDGVFQRMAEADSHDAMQDALAEYLICHPDDVYAQRLRRRLSGWLPGRGVLLYETVDPVTGLTDSSFPDPVTPMLAAGQ
eukprot:EG_transcript_1092